MKTYQKVGFLLIPFLLILTNSCRHTYYVQSDAVIVSRGTDVLLEDSALIYGMVYDAGDERLVIPNANIWIELINVQTSSNDTGFFSLKLPAGKYTIKCYQNYSNEEFVAILKDLSVSPNEKVEIKFLRGSRSE